MAFIISHKYKFIYVHIPKTGGTSLCETADISKPKCGILDRCLGKDDIVMGHQRLPDAKALLEDRFNEYFKFCTIRNPFDRVVSIYHDQKEWHRWQSFSEFVSEIDNSICSFSYIFYPATFWVNAKEIDCFILFDDLVEQTKNVLNDLGITINSGFPHLRKANRKPWQSYYDRNTKVLIRNVYRKEFELYELAKSNSFFVQNL